MTYQPCIECGELTERNRCARHQLPTRPKTNTNHVAFANNTRWKNLSKRLRKQSPFCEQCGTPNDLTVDHIVRHADRPEWAYEEDNCRILCRHHNGKISGTPATAEQERNIEQKINSRRERRLRLQRQANGHTT